MLKSSIKPARGRLNLLAHHQACESCSDIEQMLNSEEHFSDVLILVGAERRPIRAHKNILSLRSPVFRAMFQADMAERQSSQVHINELDYEVVMELLRYLYARRVRNLDELCGELLLAADKYGVEDLKVTCEQRACEQVDRENVLRLLELGSLCRADRLKSRCAWYIVEHFDEISRTPEYQRLDSAVVRELVAIYAGRLRRQGATASPTC